MPDFIVTIPVADLPTELPSPSVLMAEWTDGAAKQAYLYTAIDISAWPVAASVMGEWASDTGEPLSAISPDYGTYVANFGNDAGVSTSEKDSLKWQGHSSPKYFEYDDIDPQDIHAERYPAPERPFTIKFTRVSYGAGALPWDNGTTYAEGDYATSGGMWQSLQDGNTGNTPFGGSPWWSFINQSGPWGWKAELLSDNPDQDVNARAIAIYSDPAWTSFLWTSGAFSIDPDTGLYTSICPPGNRTTNPDPWYYSVLFGAAQEGNWQLIDTDAGAFEDRLHWIFDA